jgi:hypothetical protein
MANWRHSREYRVWRAHVIRRDKQCVICTSKEGRNAHHIHGAKYFPELRFDEDNGVCLCMECHINFHCNFKRSYREKCDMDDFLNFQSLMDYALCKGAFICAEKLNDRDLRAELEAYLDGEEDK